MFNFIGTMLKKVFCSNESSIEDWENFVFNGSIEDKKEYIKNINKELYDWLTESKQFISIEKYNKIVTLCIEEFYVRNIVIPAIYQRIQSSKEIDRKLHEANYHKIDQLDQLNWQVARNNRSF